MRCKSCKYSLENLTEDRCPECGREFDPGDPKTFDKPPVGRTFWRELLIIAVLTYLALFGYVLFHFLNQPPPTIVNNSPTVQITYVQPPLWKSILHSVILALIIWPIVIAFVYPVYLGLAITMRLIADTIRWGHHTEKH